MNTQMIRTTVYLDKELIALAKMEALKRESSLTELVARGLENELKLKPSKKRIKVGGFKLGTHDFGGYVFKREHAYED